VQHQSHLHSRYQCRPSQAEQWRSAAGSAATTAFIVVSRVTSCSSPTQCAVLSINRLGLHSVQVGMSQLIQPLSLYSIHRLIITYVDVYI